MQELDRDILAEITVTFFILSLLIVLFWGVLPVYNIIILLGLCAGLSFSWLSRAKTIPYIYAAINLLVICDLVFIGHSLLNSTFTYSEVIEIAVKGVLTLAVILSFNAVSTAFLGYLQAISVLVLMGYPVLVKDYNPFTIFLLGCYFAGWLAVFRVRLQRLLVVKPRGSTAYHASASYFLAAAVFLGGIAVSLFFFLAFPLRNVTTSGILFDERQEERLDTLEKEYYDLQDKIQRIATEAMNEFPSADVRHEMLSNLNSLLKESPDTAEVDRARQGLVSRLKSPGLGREKGEGEEKTFSKKSQPINTMDRFVDKKAQLNMKRAKDEMNEAQRKENARLKERIGFMAQANAVTSSRTHQQLSESSAQLRQQMNNSSLTEHGKEELKKSQEKLNAWKNYQLYRKFLNSAQSKIEKLDYSSQQGQFTDIVGGIECAQTTSELKKAAGQLNRLEAGVSAKSDALIKDLKELLQCKLEMLVDEKEKEVSENIKESETEAYRLLKEYAKEALNPEEKKEILQKANITVPPEIEELVESKRLQQEIKPPLPEVKPQPQIEPKKPKVFPWKKVLMIICIVVFVLFIILCFAFLVLFFLREKRKRELTSTYSKDKNEFVVKLYENLKLALPILGIEHKPFVAPLTFARDVQHSLNFKQQALLDFTTQFEEAKYSRHYLSGNTAFKAAENYNSSLKEIFYSRKKLAAIISYILSFIHRRPFFITVKEAVS